MLQKNIVFHTMFLLLEQLDLFFVFTVVQQIANDLCNRGRPFHRIRKLKMTTQALFVFSTVTFPWLISGNYALTWFVCVSQTVRESSCLFNRGMWASSAQ